MPQIIKHICILVFLFPLLSGCGGGSDSGRVFVPESGHPERWTSPSSIGTEDFHSFAVKRVESHVTGAVLFVRHCAPCHGDNASGKVGPNIQNETASDIVNDIAEVPLMRGQAILKGDEIQEIANYIASLSNGSSPVKTVIKTDSCIACHGIDLDGGISKVSCLSCHSGPDGRIGHPSAWALTKNDIAHFHGSYGRKFVNACSICHGINLEGGIGPSCSICHNGTIAPILKF